VEILLTSVLVKTFDDALGKDPNNIMQDVYMCVYVCSLQSLLYQFLALNVSYVIFCINPRVYIQQFLFVGYVQLRREKKLLILIY
jgi:hypothetical protein